MAQITNAPKPPCDLALDDIWRVYHLLRGGIDSPLSLESLAGVSLKGIDLDALYLWADQWWIATDTISVELPNNRGVICARCDRLCKSVPCKRCECNGRGANWLSKKTSTGQSTIAPPDGWVSGDQIFQQSLRRYNGDLVNK